MAKVLATRVVNMNVVLFDALHNARTKPINVVFFDTTYLTDGSKQFLENQLVITLEDINDNEAIPPGSPTFVAEDDPEIPNGYCMNDGDPIHPQMTGAFIQYYGTPKLVESREWATFQKWFVTTVSDWMIRNKITPKTKTPPVADQYLQKVIGNVTVQGTANSTAGT